MLKINKSQIKLIAVDTFVLPLFFVLLNALVIIVLIYAFLSPYFSIVASLMSEYRNEEESVFYVDQNFIDVASISNLDVPSPYFGTHYGRIEIDAIDLDVRLYWGDSDPILNKGAGQYIGSSLPGYQKPLLIGGHNLTFFKTLKDVELGDEIMITTHYAEYVYRVVKLDVVKYTDMDAFDLSEDNEVLMLYTCYPFEILWSRKTDRFVVYGERIKGPDVK